MSFTKFYDYVINDLADPRVKDWALIYTPVPTLILAAIYLSLVLVILPAYMKNRKPFNLKTIIRYYNILQIVACVTLIYGIATSGWTSEYNFTCQSVDYSDRPIALRMLQFVFWTYILKASELLETIFFLLRKKNNQVTNLHIYHHTSTLFLTWILVKFIGGGMATFPVIVNSFIHVLMYVYYLLSSFGPKWQKKLAKWKPRLTMAQMIQFCFLIGHSLTSLNPSCHVPKSLLLIYVPNIVVIFYMFWDFYKSSYMKKQLQKNKAH